jgi:hypothetical protein
MVNKLVTDRGTRIGKNEFNRFNHQVMEELINATAFLSKEHKEQEQLDQALEKALAKENEAIRKFHDDVRRLFDELTREVLNNDSIFKKGGYTPTQVSVLVGNIMKFSKDFEQLAGKMKNYSRGRDIRKFVEYCQYISKQVALLAQSVKDNEIQLGAANPRQIKEADDIIHKLEKAVVDAYNLLDSDLRKKWAINHRFKRSLEEFKNAKG